jgi:hypothetical protein
MYVACTSATNAQLFINEGVGVPAPPDHVYCTGCQFHPDPTHFHSITINGSVDSGLINSLVCPGRMPALGIGPEAVDPVDVNNKFPASC